MAFLNVKVSLVVNAHGQFDQTWLECTGDPAHRVQGLPPPAWKVDFLDPLYSPIHGLRLCVGCS